MSRPTDPCAPGRQAVVAAIGHGHFGPLQALQRLLGLLAVLMWRARGPEAQRSILIVWFFLSGCKFQKKHPDTARHGEEES